MIPRKQETLSFRLSLALSSLLILILLLEPLSGALAQKQQQGEELQSPDVTTNLSIDPLDPPEDPEPEPSPSGGSCDAYAGCAALQGTVNTKLNGPVVYSFDDATLLAQLGSQTAVDDFKNRARAAAAGWSSSTGISITEGQPGQAGSVTITTANDTKTRNDGGFTFVDPNNSSRRIISIADQFGGWSSEGKDRLLFHEWGHILGLADVGPDECAGVETIMRQLRPVASGLQLRNGYTCKTVGSGTDPNACPPETQLPQPPKPTDCDINKAKSLQPPPAPSGGGGGGGGDIGGGGTAPCVDQWGAWGIYNNEGDLIGFYWEYEGCN
jgi:hypothetical protein